MHDRETATSLVTEFAGELFNQLWNFMDHTHFGVEEKDCFEMSKTLREVWKPTLASDDFICLVPATFSEETINWCMSVLLL